MSIIDLLSTTLIMDSIFDNLSASAVSSLLCACHITFSDETIKKYLSPRRELLEFKPWIDDRLSERCKVTLVGIDLDRLRDRIENPATYWARDDARDSIKVWLAVTPNGQQEVSGKTYLDLDGNEVSGLCTCGGRPGQPYYSYANRVIHFRTHHQHITSTFLVPSGMMTYYSRDDCANWYKSKLSNDNGVEIYFFARQIEDHGERLLPSVTLMMCISLKPRNNSITHLFAAINRTYLQLHPLANLVTDVASTS